jgi:hypothetical protein
METYPASKQRSRLLELATALGSADNALRRDECGDPRINGIAGHIYAVPGGFQMFIATQSKRAWGFAKGALASATVTIDGDDEGMLFMDRLPTVEEAAAIRDYAGIRKRQELSAESAAAKQARGKAIADTRWKAAA